MRNTTLPLAGLPLLAAGVLVWPSHGMAQTFTANYEIASPAWQIRGDSSGGGLSVQAGRTWFGQVGLGRTMNPTPPLPGQNATSEVVNVGGGYRWSDGQSLSMQLSKGGNAGQRLGLAVSYDWPRYFVRLSYDGGLSPVPQENLRFSAGMRF
jgi:hypothetical protein